MHSIIVFDSGSRSVTEDIVDIVDMETHTLTGH